MKFIKYSLLALFAVLIGLVIFIATIDLNQYKDDITTIVKEKTGRELSIDGDLHFALSMVPTVAVEGVRFANADWGTVPEMLKVGKFEAQVSLLPLLHGQVQVIRILLDSPEVILETNKQGEGNWVLVVAGEKPSAAQDTGAAKTGALPALSVNEVNVRNASFTYKDGRTGRTTLLGVDEISAATSGTGEQIALSIKAAYNKIPMEMTAKVGSLNTLMANESYPFDMHADISQAKLDVSGQVAKPMQGAGIEFNLSFEVESLPYLNKLAETELPVIGPVAVSGHITLSDATTVQVKDLKVRAGETRLAGSLSVQTKGERPALTANLQSDLVDLTPFLGEPPAQEPKPEKLFSKEKLPLGSLKTADADLQLAVKTLKSGENVLRDVKLPVKLVNGHLTISPLTARLAGGTVKGNVDLDSRRGSAVLKAGLNVNQMELGKLPQLQKDASLEGGKTDITIKAEGKGNSVAEIMAGLNGKLLIIVGPGKIPNSKIDLAGADLLLETFSKLNPLAQKESQSELECAVINFKIDDGLAVTDKGIALQTSKMNIVGSGGINLKDETLDIGIQPHAREGLGINIGAVTGAARLGGTLANPKPKIDTKGALKAGLSAGAAVATFGLSALAQGVFDKTTADPYPCDTALGKAPPKTAKQTEQKATTTTTEQKTETKGVTEKATDKVKGALKSLFGD